VRWGADNAALFETGMKEDAMQAAAIDRAVVAQATDDSVDNKEPVAFRQVISQIIGVAITLLLFKGVIEPSEGTFLGLQAEILVGAVISLAGLIGAVFGRMKASSPKTAAGIAVTNAVLPASSTPTLTVNEAAVEAAVLSVR
jgi:hypothetical protein